VDRLCSVASFFVSRVDTKVDPQLDKLGDPKHIRGKIAIANAAMAYRLFETTLASERWKKLAAKGARPQRPLWASTSTKDPSYKDTLYVEALIGRDTVDTIPPATMDAFRDHGVVKADAVEQDLAGAKAVMARLEKQGISLKEITDELVKEGVKSFADSFDKLLGVVGERRKALLKGVKAA
jgi:transaldolase/glucose-6-phosphate isomerase